MRASSAGGNDSPGSIRRRKSYIEVVPGGPHVLLEPVPFAEEWILVTKDIAYAGMPVYMDTPPMAFFLGAAGASLVVQTESMGRLSSHGSEASESADLPPFLQKPVSLPGSVGDESAGRDQIDDPPTPSSKGPMTPSSKGNGSKNSADRSAISDVSSDGQAGKLPLPRQLAPKSEPSSPHPAAAPTGFPNLVSEKRGLRPVGPSFSFESDGGVEELGIRKGNVSMRLENPVNLPVRLICKIVNAAQLPKPQHGTNIDPYCLLSVSQSNKKSRTRTLTNTEDPEWDEEFVYIVQDLNTCIHVEVMHKDVLKDELLGQATIRCREILDNDLNELWSKEYVLYSKQGQPTSSVLFFQFKLEPVLLDVIRFTEDEEQGRLVEPFDNDIIDIWKVRWEGSGECGWYNCGFNGVYNLRCAVEWSQAVDDFKAHHGGDDKLVRRALRPGSKEIGEEQYAKLPSHMRVNMKDVRGRSFLSKSLRIGSSAAAKRTATLGRNAARQREREREHPSDPFRTAGISAVQRLSIGIGRRLSTLFSRSPLALSPEPKGSTSSEALLNLNLKLPLHAPVQPPLRRQSLQPQRVDSLANLNKPRRFSDVNSGTLSSAGSEFGREASVRELLRESSPRSFRPSNHPLLDSAPSSAFDPHRLHSHSEEGVRMAGSGEGGEGGGVEGAGGGGGGGGGGGAGRFLSSASPPHPSHASPTDHRQPAPPPLRAPAAPPPIAPPHPATEAAAASAGGEAGEAGAGAGAREAEGELPEAQAAGAKLEGEGEGEGGKEEGEEGPAKVTSRASEELDLQWRQST